MDFHLERQLRLHTEPGKKQWAISEIDAEGKAIGLDQIPWQWSFYFTATSCVLSDTIEIRQPLNFKFSVNAQDGPVTERESGGKEERTYRRETIQVQLRSGDSRVDSTKKHPTSFKMFGTDRAIKKFTLNVVQIDEPDEQERCSAWGCPSYTSEGADSRDETTDDCVGFYPAVKPEAFARYVEKINEGAVDEIVLRVRQVDGFYSEWSPSIATDRVKVLTREQEHKVALPSGYASEPPRLGLIGEASLFINRKLEFGVGDLEADPEVEDKPGLRAERQTPGTRVSVDQKLLQVLTSLRRAAWAITWLLALIFVVMLLRR